MNFPHAHRRPGAFSPRPPTSPVPSQGTAQSNDPSESDSSTSSPVAARSGDKRSPHPQQSLFARPLFQVGTSSNGSSSTINSFSRPSISHANSDQSLQKNAPFRPDLHKHKREYSQGFFEPSLPTASSSEQAMAPNLTASQIAAQAAMQHQASNQNLRNRSQTVPSPQSPPETVTGRRKPTPIQASADTGRRPSGGISPGNPQYQNGLVGGHMAAASAANAAFPRSGQLSPGLTNFEVPADKEHKLKTERSKIKLFSKPKQLGISSIKDSDQKEKPLPSPNKMGPSGPSALSKIVNPSMTSLADSVPHAPLSLYAINNASTSTLVPSDKQNLHEKEKAHKHHFLSRQKHKLKDRIDDHVHPLSSTSSNSKPAEISAPQPLYSFAPLPTSPGPTATSFAKSVSGLDLRHGGRALREKKKEEKASAAQPPHDKRPENERTDRVLSTSLGSLAAQGFLGPVASSGGSALHIGEVSAPQIGLQGLGLANMSPEDAWDFLKAKLLIVFEGEELRMPVEDLNRLVSVHIKRCILRRLPTIIIEDLRDLLQTGFQSLDQTLRGAPDSRLVTRLVDMWLFIFGTILPYMQAVFLPLDLEFKGHGPLMAPLEAAEFWGANPDSRDDAFGNEFDVRSIVLLSYRDNVILPRHDSLKAIFSRLSLDSINATVSLVNNSPEIGFSGRPGTAASQDPGFGSFNSQGSTLLGEAAGGRSRATSNLSAELPPFASPRAPPRPPPPQDSSQITETVGRMLQCVSVLASVQSGDSAQAKMEGLAKELKLNWLGRGRTGRNRKGFVGTRVAAIRHRSSQRKVEQVEQSRRESVL